ncbi:hypothetical protein QTO34_014516 [Cnephaeus nilssonii]|uniref:Uncharacterized protein n=1 Tax=Cnephaeus nilssonii TaxID=3371016 RepID=A0AA40I6Q9_CNENI|nr:hypothetical protein QTO34_014516 [Eptesicus nilssonii]
MESKPAVGTVRTWSQGPAPVRQQQPEPPLPLQRDSRVEEATGCEGFSLIHLVATGICCFLGSGLLTLAVYLSCQHCQRQSQESTLVHPATPNHLHYKGGGTPKNEKYTPMEFKTLNKNNLIPDDKAGFYPLQQTNVYTTTYYPSPLIKHSFRPEASPGQRCFPNS